MEQPPASAVYEAVCRPGRLGALLRLGPQALSVAWANPSRGLHSAGLGVAGVGGGRVRWVSEAPQRPPPGPWFGGWAFDAARPWAGFPAERWVLPEVLAWWDGRAPWLASFGPEGVGAQALERRLDAVEELDPHTTGVQGRRLDGSQAAWRKLVDGALSAIDAGRFEKVVCARVIDVESPEPFPERAILKALEARHKQCWSFLVRGDDGRAFVGASPEVLCEARDGVLHVDALAGTAAGGQGGTLLRSEKERREHAAVADEIARILAPFSTLVERPASPSVKVLANVDHLHTPFRAQLKPGVTPLEVARALHPTPAVAGLPREPALAFLKGREGFSRGWYAGAVGAMGEGGVTLAVALRSALLAGTRAQVFVGAGIVEGSRGEDEWLETERKARALLPALGVHEDGVPPGPALESRGGERPRA
ncbi:MAG: isochorismate synthase [Myxococcales bacterium]|nr:isochorismate synthase [Myxococcales bacterium]